MTRQAYRVLDWLAAAVILLVLTGLLIPASRSSNCGGNSAALNDVRIYALIARQAPEGPDSPFVFEDLTHEEQSWLRRMLDDFWLNGAGFLVDPRPDRLAPAEPKRLLIVCDRAFRNVPRNWIGSAPPTHAAAFADGSTALISEAEFAVIDRSVLVPLRDLVPADPKPR